MEPPSPPSSPAESCISSTAPESPSSSPLKSPKSSPMRSDRSSPPKEVFSSPFNAAPSSPSEPPSSPFQLESPFHAYQYQKRRKFNFEEEHSTPLIGHQHSRNLFSDATSSGCNNSVIAMEEMASDQELTSTGTLYDEPTIATATNQVVSTLSTENLGGATSSDSSSEESDVESSKSSSEASSVSSSDAESEQSSSDGSESELSEAEEQNSSDDEPGVHYSPKVYPSCELTEDEGVLVLMDLFTKHKLSKKVIGEMLKGILKFLPKGNNFPKTQYGLFEYIKKLCPISEEKIHYYCSQCMYYLGLNESNCTLCSGESHKFYQLPLADQIRNLFEKHELAKEMDKYLQRRSDSDTCNTYSDLLDGSEFKRAVVEGSYNIVLMGHTDGISVSKSSNVSLWPLEWVIANLPHHLRFKFVLISGIWVDECKPYMNTMLKPFVDELKVLHEHGVQWVHPTTKEINKTFVSVCSFCVDAPVRAQLQNILSHGGKHCCHVCEQKMKRLPSEPAVPGVKKKRRRRVYNFEEEPAEMRTVERMQEQGLKARRNVIDGGTLKPEKGVKGPSLISDIPGCDRSTAVFPEYMHLLLCLLKEFMKLWFEKSGPWSLQHHRQKIDEFLLKIKVPDFITRIPRSTEHFTKWKAHELRSFLLFFSAIILSQCMRPEYFQHWLLLVSAFNLLLQDCVSISDVRRANIFMRLFCREFATLYSPAYYTYYVHNLCHIALTVERHGPLHSNSAFAFENFNGTLAKYIHGTKNQSKELVNNVKLAMGVETLRARCLIAKPTVSDQRPIVEFRNPIRNFSFSRDEVQLLLAGNYRKDSMEVFFRAVIGRVIFTSSLYRRQKRRNNFTICYLNSSQTKAYGEIRLFLQDTIDVQMALIQKFDVDHLRSFYHDATQVAIKHIVPILPTAALELINVTDILFKVIRVENYVCLRPNSHEYNL